MTDIFHIPTSREKLIHAIIYFAAHTKMCQKTKLFKLLSFLDFEHYKETGRTVTGLEYYAWPKGPVPLELENEIQNPKLDLKSAVAFLPVQNDGGFDIRQIRAKISFDESLFSRRELRILEHVAFIFAEADAATMIDATHLPNEPWDITYNKMGMKQKKIDFKLALQNPNSITEERADEIAAEDEAMKAILRDA